MSTLRIVSWRRALMGVVVACVASLTSAATSGPTDVVRQTVEKIIAALQREEPSREAKWAEIGRLIDANFDFRSMSQSVLATNWQAATKEEKRQFVEYFAQYLEDTYRKKIEAYTNQRVEYSKETVKQERAVVDTFIVTAVKRIPVNYKLKLNDGQWTAYDVNIDGFSMVNDFRNTFDAIVKSEGMDGLLRDLEGRIADYKAHHGGAAPASAK